MTEEKAVINVLVFARELSLPKASIIMAHVCSQNMGRLKGRGRNHCCFKNWHSIVFQLKNMKKSIFFITCKASWHIAAISTSLRGFLWTAKRSKISFGKTGNNNVQLVLQHCCKTSWKALLSILPATFKTVNNVIYGNTSLM